ncbi:MAG: polysaccharide biosynthesis C-terminal domain-containing protein [Myxococcales bacterium]|nr:polysaccharide biosynthesis C-terminal domain-containing protein [Myxococcales bacterium]
MVRALGADGYGRWWWTFVLLEAASAIGVLGTDLYVRREIPQCPDDDTGRARATAIIGTALAVVTATGIGFALLQIALAVPIANALDDRALLPFLITLAFQPVMWSIGAVLAAAIQSHHHLGALAALRGIVFPALVAAVYLIAWKAELPITVTLVLMLSNSVLAMLITVALFARYFSLGATLRATARPSLVRPAVSNGVRLVIPLSLFMVGGKLDLYALGAYYDPAYVGLYAACLQVAGLVPSVRGLFDPIAQAQIGALFHRDSALLGASMRKLARLCAFALAPAFVLTVAIGQPVLGWLVGVSAPQTFEPIALLSIGNLIAGIAVASWILPMTFAGRPMTMVAAVSGLAKLGLLLWLVPRYGAIGAAIATSAGGIIALHFQTLLGVREVGFRAFPASIIRIVLLALGVAGAARALYVALVGQLGELAAVGATGAASMAVLGAGIFALMTGEDRSELRRLLGLRPAGVPSSPS